MAKSKKNSVYINIRKHDIRIDDGKVIHICHQKSCKEKCSETRLIVEYLKDELFVSGDIVVAETFEKEAK
jgi:hypothetical protein